MSCDVGEMTERLKNELCSFVVQLCSFSNLSITSPTSQLILQPFCRFTYITADSPTLLLLHLCESSFSNPSFASPTSQALHLRHLASCPWYNLYCQPSMHYVKGCILNSRKLSERVSSIYKL